MAIDNEDHLFVTDPDGFRVLEFDLLGNIIHAWGDNSTGIDGFGSPSGIASDSEGRIWVTDSENNFALRFSVPDMIDILPQNLPALPQSAMPLVYNPNTGLIENGLMIPVYRLDADQKDWVPVISDGIASLMQPNSHPIKDAEGTWYLLSPENTPLFVWDKDLLVWVSTNPN